MDCPVCKVALVISERQGIEIDYCPRCRGVWLDRGELDRIIERSQHYQDSDDDYPTETSQRELGSRDTSARRGPPSTAEQSPHQSKKRESFWSELFDFD